MYRFNNGRGAVVCDQCWKTIDEDISYDEYKELYLKKSDIYICPKCQKEIKSDVQTD
jgi:DNA-directed RNA polymerase subunit RPC12/RpoP